jgi:hypothetical protein
MSAKVYGNSKKRKLKVQLTYSVRGPDNAENVEDMDIELIIHNVRRVAPLKKKQKAQ